MMDNSGIPQNKKTAVPNPAVGAAREQPLSPSPLDRTRPASTISSLPCEFNYQVPVPLDSVDGKTLMNMEIPPLCYCVEPILPHGLFVLAGPPKAGKTCSNARGTASQCPGVMLGLNLSFAARTSNQLAVHIF